jgi:hypothetical protein
LLPCTWLIASASISPSVTTIILPAFGNFVAPNGSAAGRISEPRERLVLETQLLRYHVSVSVEVRSDLYRTILVRAFDVSEVLAGFFTDSACY